ncbi:MAG: phosphate ABC transporter substrate-binding protein [Candidatus Odinarchaeota archaeon]
MEKNGIWIVAAVGMVAMFFVGWGITSLTTSGGTGSVSIIMTGSTTCEPIITECANDFMELNSNVDISVSGTGSGDGISDTIDGQSDIGMSSRNIKPTENASAGNDLTDYKFAKDGIAVIIDAGHPNAAWLETNGLTMDQVFLIYNGTYDTWNDIDPSLSSETIDVHTRPDGSGTRATFEELVLYDGVEELGENSGYTSSVTGYTEVASNTVMVTTVATNQYGFGYCGLGYVDDSIIAVPIDGVEPEIATVLDDSYPISRSLHLTTNGEATGWVKAFIDFIYGPQGQAVVAKEGFIRLWF